MGSTAGAGHYVAHVRVGEVKGALGEETGRGGKVYSYRAGEFEREGVTEVKGEVGWVCYNDNKVFVTDSPAVDEAYMYVFERVQ
jgi:uncharacterized UBP type Zn finger protein